MEIEIFLTSKAKNVKAYGIFENGTVLVKKGSTVSKNTTSTFHSYKTFREGLINEKIIVEMNEEFVFAKDYTFNSPSAASAVILGSESNGWDVWKDSNKNKLKNYKKQKN